MLTYEKTPVQSSAGLTLALAVTGTTLPTAWAAESEENAPLDCASALLMEAESGRVLFEYNADDRHAPASITKIMTMLLVCEAVDAGQISLDDIVTTSPYASSMGGSEIWLEPYETMTVDEMLRATAIASANDAAVALGEHLAGTEAMFADKMNQKAAQLGMDSTHFVNACGAGRGGPLHHRPGHCSHGKGAASAPVDHRLHHRLAGYPPGRRNRTGEHQPPGAVL